jgi:catechol 2,3-dioxygenase-like lactoylglutathione lyase family enzyme
MNSLKQTMRFNHISFPSSDYKASLAFFERHLGCTSTLYDNYAVLKRHDFDIVVEDARERNVVWPENFHIGFEVSTAAAVARLYSEFVEAGTRMTTGLIKSARGSRFFCEIPGGIQVEINTREDAAEEYRASFGLAVAN